MALGMDPRFDLSKAYWIVAGIGGGDPADVSLGSAVWADHVVDGDLAYEIDARQIPESWPTGFVPLRKKGKLPHHTRAVEYALEYGSDVMEMHLDAILEDERVMLVDDLIATGGTALAAMSLLTQAKACIVAAAFVIDLPELGGADRLRAT